MKKLYAFVAVFMFMVAAIALKASAGSQYNWGTATGANWRTPDDTTVQIGQALVVTSSVPYPTVGTSSTTPMGIASLTATQVVASTPAFNGELIFCSNCVIGFVCVSTGSTTGGSYAVVNTSNTGAGALACK